MKDTTKRSILRSIHIVFALPIVGYIYGPPSETLQYLPYFGSSTFPSLSFRDYGCGKAMSFADFFREDRMTAAPDRVGTRQFGMGGVDKSSWCWIFVHSLLGA
jgi:hypothetical protein